MISIKNTVEMPLKDIIACTQFADRPDAQRTLTTAVQRSVSVQYGFVDDRLVCLWGLIPPTILSNSAYIWLLTTNIAAEHKFLLVRHSQRWIERALSVYPTLVGDIVLPNPPAYKWLQWLGAEFGNPEGKLLRFVIRRKPNG